MRFVQLRDFDWLNERYVRRGMTFKQIADELGCSKQSVCNALRKHGLEARRHIAPPTIHPGDRYGRLTVLQQAGSAGRDGRIYAVRCDCGQEFSLLGGSLRTGNTRSCGCLKKEGGLLTFVFASTFSSWKAIRGETLCDRWTERDGFAHFLEDMGERPEGASLKRIDPGRAFAPDNCKWD